MITFAVEPWERVWREAVPLWDQHYAEVGEGRFHEWKIDPNFAVLDRIAANGALHIVAARQAGALVGYHASIIEPLVHYKHVLAAKSDLYWLRPDCRVGRNAVRLFQAVERSCAARGVQMLYDGTKTEEGNDHSKLFEFLGYREIEKRYSKRIAP